MEKQVSPLKGGIDSEEAINGKVNDRENQSETMKTHIPG